ncbi:MAG TPA: hypothetical protein VFN87_19800 [Solirubrobacteraceae bacterium]|nr:hypothetical protein [Solirubrobacteraceae bacterium]
MAIASDTSRRARARALAVKVPQITLVFWVLKLITTGMGESMSDYLAHHSIPIGGAVGILGFSFAMWLQFRTPEYRAPVYWFAVMMVAIFGTMGADVLHVVMNIPYTVTTPFFAIAVAVIFLAWYRVEGTLSIHSINTPRRELFYWVAVLATFALGTAAGDLAAYTLNLGFWPAALLFAAVMAVPAIGWAGGVLNPVFAFWFAYIVTRPLGASIADGLGKPIAGGLGLGDGLVSGIAFVAFVGLVAWVTVTRRDVQRPAVAGSRPPHRAHPHMPESIGVQAQPAEN